MYAELHCLTNFSFLRSASHPHELVERARDLGYQAIAITDECSLAGIVKAHVAAKACNIRLLVGAELLLEEGFRVIALVTDRTAYSELSGLITLARRRSQKGEYQVRLCDLEHNLRHNLLIWHPTYGDLNNEEYATILRKGFYDRLWIGVNNLLRGDEPERYDACYALARHWKIPLVACGDVQLHTPKRKSLHDALTAIRHNTSIEQLGFRRQGNSERYLRSLRRLRNLYPEPLLLESVMIALRCNFSLDELRYEYPPEVVPEHMTPEAYLKFLVAEGAKQRWPEGVPPEIQPMVDKELRLIRELKYEYYFLTVHDIVHFARANKILCQGRGSAANSVVCYCLGITEVSPQKASLLFERFLSKERNEPPDIDVDFEHERREEVIQYIYKKYGRERAAIAATVIYYRTRSAIRDIGKALGLDPLFIAQLAGSLAWWDKRKDLEKRFNEQGFAEHSRISELFLSLVQQIMGFPRHLSQHVGGFIITKSPISTLVPVENASMPDRTVIQWDKEDIESMGLLKVDVLALGILTAIRKCLDLLANQYQQPMRMQDIPPEDEATYKMLQQADSVGVFQVESRAQMAMLPRLKPKTYYDLVIEVALVRPGPIQGDMVHPYLRRREGIEPESYPNDAIKAVLGRTLGVPIFQEQVIKLAMVAADFTAGDADRLRRAMGSWGKTGDLENFRDKLLTGMTNNGYPLEFAERLYEQMKGFGAYGFPESHAASFALLVYFSAYLKCHYPAAFYCSLLNSQPMGFYSPSQLVQDARRHDVEVRPVDVHYSHWEHTLEAVKNKTPALRLGFCLVKGLQRVAIGQLINARTLQKFSSALDIRRRAKLDPAQLELLIGAGALQSLSGHRHQSHWDAAGIEEFAPLPIDPLDLSEGTELAAPTEIQDLTSDYNHTGLTLGRHPMALLREHFAIFRSCKKQSELGELGHGRFVRIAGIVTGRQRPGTESGVIFLTLEDETGNTNVVVWKDLQVRCRDALLTSKLMMVKGVVETDNNVIHVMGGELIDCSSYLNDMVLRSRDFH